MNVFSALPQITPGMFVSEAKSLETVPVEKAKKIAHERCGLQADVALFLNLREQKNAAHQTNTLCETNSQVLFEASGKSIVHSDETLESTIREMVTGYPMERMALAIAKYDREVAALIVGIAKKESDWGRRSPSDASGADCFNYWGYKGAGSRGVAMGHGCFGSPEEAVVAVGNRLVELVALRQTSAPEKMLVWKCGASCQGHSVEDVKKWIADVSLYYDHIAVHPVKLLIK